MLCLFIYLLLCFSFYFFFFCGVVVIYARDCCCKYVKVESMQCEREGVVDRGGKIELIDYPSVCMYSKGYLLVVSCLMCVYVCVY